MTFLNSMSLSAQNKRWLGEHLIEQAAKEESMAEDAPHTKRIAKVKRRANSPSDEELSARFAGKEVPEMPEEDPDWSVVINANIGKTIEPIEKWL